MVNTKKRWTAEEIDILKNIIPQKVMPSLKDCLGELPKAAGFRHQS